MSSPFFLWRSLHSAGGEIREKVGRVALGSKKGSGPRMRERIVGWGSPVACGHQASCCMICFSIRLAKTATAKGGWG